MLCADWPLSLQRFVDVAPLAEDTEEVGRRSAGGFQKIVEAVGGLRPQERVTGQHRQCAQARRGLGGRAGPTSGVRYQPLAVECGQWDAGPDQCSTATAQLRGPDNPTNPQADFPLFRAFLDQIFDENKKLIRFVQKLVGYSLTGRTNEQLLVILWGTGANGKSTLIEVLSAMLGEYAAKCPITTTGASFTSNMTT